MMVKQEARRLQSQYLDGTLMYPGVTVFTWVKAPSMPWVLVSMKPVYSTEGEEA